MSNTLLTTPVNHTFLTLNSRLISVEQRGLVTSYAMMEIADQVVKAKRDNKITEEEYLILRDTARRLIKEYNL